MADRLKIQRFVGKDDEKILDRSRKPSENIECFVVFD